MNIKHGLFLLSTMILLLVSHFQSHAQVEVTTIQGEKYTGFIIETKDGNILFKTIDNFELKFPKNYIEEIKPVVIQIKTINGNKYEGRVLKQDDSTLTIETKGKMVLSVPKNQIFRRSYQSSFSSGSYNTLGLTVIMPGGININMGHNFENTGVRATFGYIGGVYGFQFNFLYNLNKSEHFEHNISIGAGYSAIEKTAYDYFGYKVTLMNTWTYLGAFYDINVYGAFLELGLTAGQGDFTTPQLSIQLGYVYRFND